VTNAYEAGDTEAMMAAFGRLIRLSQVLYGHGGIRATKALLQARAQPGGPPRPPRLPLGEAERKQLSELVDAVLNPAH
jgi:dihydrodipicolinate synthase/N-acetylneuraminate lyase